MAVDPGVAQDAEQSDIQPRSRLELPKVAQALFAQAHAAIGWSGWPSAYAPRIGMIDTAANTDHAALQSQKLTVIQTDLEERDAAGRQHGTAFAAPGVNLWTAASISGGRLRSGTSYAAPFVTAALAVEQMRIPGQPIGDAISRRRLLMRVGLAAGAAYAAPIPPLPSPAPCRRG